MKLPMVLNWVGRVACLAVLLAFAYAAIALFWMPAPPVNTSVSWSPTLTPSPNPRNNCTAQITECCDVNTNGTYNVSREMTTGNGYACIWIHPTGAGSMLDCNGHSITGGGTPYGILLDDTHGVTIRNCRITRFTHAGILLNSSAANYITNNTISVIADVGRVWVYGRGIELKQSNGNLIAYNHVNETSRGISAESSSGNTLMQNVVTSSTRGIDIFDASANNTVSGNILEGCDEYGVLMSRGSNGNILANNTVTGSLAGISMESNSYNETLSNNHVSNNREYDVYCHDGSVTSAELNTCNSTNCANVSCLRAE